MEGEKVAVDGLRMRVLDFVSLHPGTIRSLFCDGSWLYVARNNYSEIFKLTGQTHQHIHLYQVLRLGPCEAMYSIDGVLVMVLWDELRVYGEKWKTYSYTTPLVGNRVDVQQQRLYTFHENESMVWDISSESGVNYRTLHKSQTPYHVTQGGRIEGYGRQIVPHQKGQKFTVCEPFPTLPYLLVGSDTGHLHIYQTKYNTHVKTFRQHQAPILCIKPDQVNECVYVSGVDSKVIALKYMVEQGWVLVGEVRAQSHDIYALEMHAGMLLSGGLTTDICFYQLNNGALQHNQWSHKVSLTTQPLLTNLHPYLIVNKYRKLEIWKVGEEKQKVELVVEYELAAHKSIRCIRGCWYQENEYFIFVVTEQECVIWVFSEASGLSKHCTISEQYQLIELHPTKQFLFAVTINNQLEKLNYRTGKVTCLFSTKLDHPTHLSYADDNKLLMGSTYTQQVLVYDVKTHKPLINVTVQDAFTCVEWLRDRLLLGFVASPWLQLMDMGGNCENYVKLPFTGLRFTGWITHGTKYFWYGIGEGRVVIVSHLHKQQKRKKIRTKQLPRVAGVVGPLSLEDGRQYLGVVPYNFSQMISQSVQAVIVKKIS